MFLSLVYIELIRLSKNRSLKFGIPASIFLIVCLSFVSMFGLDRMDTLNVIDIDINNSAKVLSSMFFCFYEMAAILITAVSTVFTTCDYYKYRLAINIEGVERNRFKLCLSELTGIALFIAIICGCGVPFAMLSFLIQVDSSVISLSVLSEVLLDYLYVATFFFVLSLLISVSEYFIAKITKSKGATFASIGALILVYVILIGFCLGFVQGLDSGSDSFSNMSNLIICVLVVFAFIPMVTFAIVLAIKDRKSDRL